VAHIDATGCVSIAEIPGVTVDCSVRIAGTAAAKVKGNVHRPACGTVDDGLGWLVGRSSLNGNHLSGLGPRAVVVDNGQGHLVGAGSAVNVGHRTLARLGQLDHI
jgi:hypothetical protein